MGDPKLRKVSFKRSYYNDDGKQTCFFNGYFHTWGQRGDETGTEFFGVVEDENGQCWELDPSQITFAVNEVK